MKINRFTKSKEDKIRDAVGLPTSDPFPTKGAVQENLACENTMSYAPPVKNGYKALNAISRLAPDDGVALYSKVGAREQHSLMKDNVFDYGASGGASSPNTEVNAESQGVRSEVPSAPTDK